MKDEASYDPRDTITLEAAVTSLRATVRPFADEDGRGTIDLPLDDARAIVVYCERLVAERDALHAQVRDMIDASGQECGSGSTPGSRMSTTSQSEAHEVEQAVA